MKKHYNIKVTGKVQGVFYRDSTKRKAIDLGIRGFVKNNSDGSVYIEAEAEVNSLEELVNWCKSGPPRAEVATVDFQISDIVGFEDFSILR